MTLPVLLRLSCCVFGMVFSVGIALAVDEPALPQAALNLSLDPPAINTAPGPEYDDQVRVGNMIIGIDRTPKGRLWAARRSTTPA